MDATPSPLGVAAASPTPLPQWPDATRWTPPPGDLSIRLSASPAPAWTRPAQAAAALLLLLTLSLLGWHAWTAQRWGCRPSLIEADAEETPYLDLNRADHAQLLQLPGVGESLAQRIVVYREEHHGFRDVDELRRVGGIGPKMLEKLRPFIRVELPSSEEEDADVRRPMREAPKETRPPTAGKKQAALARRIDINRATTEELRRLPGIGPKLSQRILDTRKAKPFQSVDDLRRVPGIGAKTLERLRPHVVVGR